MWTRFPGVVLITGILLCLSSFAFPQSNDINESQALYRRIKESGVGKKPVYVDFSSDEKQVHPARQQTKDLNDEDACSHIPNVKGKWKLRILKFPNVTWACCPCGKGEKLVGPCRNEKPSTTQCAPCNPLSYMDKDAHEERECIVPSLSCDSETESYIPHTPTSPPKCHCRTDLPLYRASNGSCLLHSECPPGEGVKTLGSRVTDTKCEPCEEFYESLIWSRTEICQLQERVKNHPQNIHLHSAIETTTTKTTQDHQQEATPTQHGTTQLITIPAASREWHTEKIAFGVIGIIVFVIAVCSCLHCKASPLSVQYSAVWLRIRESFPSCFLPSDECVTELQMHDLSPDEEAGVNPALADSVVLNVGNSSARFDADADAAEENRSFEEANETEETSLLEANSTNTLPPISTGKTEETYCKRKARKQKEKATSSSSNRDDESVCEPSTSTSFSAIPHESPHHGPTDKCSSFQKVLNQPPYLEAAPAKLSVEHERREMMKSIKMELSSRVGSDVSHRLFRKKTTFDDHQINTFLDDMSGKSSEYQFNAVFKKLEKQLPWEDFNPQTLYDFFMDPNPLFIDRTLAEFLKINFPEACRN